MEQLNRQLLGCWTALFCFAEDCSPDAVRRFEARVQGDARCVVVQAPLDQSARRAVSGWGGAECILAVGGAVVLRDHALYSFAVAAAEHPEARLIYSDEDRLSADGTRFAPWFKPRFSPELLRHDDYLGSCFLWAVQGGDLPGST